MSTEFLDIKENDFALKNRLDSLLEELFVQPVGWGYIDCIVKLENVGELIKRLTELNIGISHLTWWCDCTGSNEDHEGSPHGMGGPPSIFYDGWFSEMNWDYIPFERNEDVEKYIFEDFPKEESYLNCVVPALWLKVPEEWRNIRDIK